MAESASPHSQTATSPLTGPSSLGSVVEPQGLSTVDEVPHYNVTYHGNGSLDNRLLSKTQLPRSSRDASLESSTGPSYDEKQSETPSHRLHHTGPAKAARQAWQRSEAPPDIQRNGNGNGAHHDTKADGFSKSAPPKEKRGGFRNTLRRMFGRRSTRDRTSMPNPAVYPRHDPEEFITSATDVKAKRVASAPAPAPAPGLLRTSGLSSHPPHQNVPSPAPATNMPVPPQPERRPPERPARPRRASVPSLVLNKQEMEAVDAAMTELGLQNPQEPTVDAQNIGFAVTNGSNPRRRSRSVGGFQDSEHRMSPIQWRRWRRRSDEIRYWRASSDLTSLGIKGLDSPDMAQKDDNETTDENEADIGEHNADFNFGLPRDTTQDQERIGLEERIVTLEIKLMDFEYAISKMQAGSAPPSRRHSQHIGMGERQDSIDSYVSSDRPHAPIDPSPSTPQETPPMTSSKWVQDITPKPRPTSVATTLKPGHSGQHGPLRKDSVDRSTRSSLTGLTIDHYTALITLIRNEQSARMRLEQEVSTLQQRLDYLSPQRTSHSHAHSLSQHSHSRSLSSDQRRRGVVDIRGGGHLRHPRPRSGSYSTNETDTDDDAFHDVYVTPNITPVEYERGEYERGTFERVAGVEEGMAF